MEDIAKEATLQILVTEHGILINTFSQDCSLLWIIRAIQDKYWWYTLAYNIQSYNLVFKTMVLKSNIINLKSGPQVTSQKTIWTALKNSSEKFQVKPMSNCACFIFIIYNSHILKIG